MPDYTNRVARVADLLKLQPAEHFNSGVMVLKAGYHRQVETNIQRLAALMQSFLWSLLRVPLGKGELWFIEEVCARFFVSMTGLQRIGALAPELAPYYHEYATKEVPGTGAIIHTWSAYFDVAIAEFGSPEEIAELLALGRPASAKHRSFQILGFNRKLNLEVASASRAKLARRWLQL